MVDGVKSDENVEYKKVETKKDETFTWQGVCKVCGKQTRMKEYKDLSSDLHNLKYVKTECGHKFLVEVEE